MKRYEKTGFVSADLHHHIGTQQRHRGPDSCCGMQQLERLVQTWMQHDHEVRQDHDSRRHEEGSDAGKETLVPELRTMKSCHRWILAWSGVPLPDVSLRLQPFWAIVLLCGSSARGESEAEGRSKRW